MTGRLPSTVLRHIHGLVRAGQGAPSDRECLERFAARRDEEAFAVLVRRHGPMVRGVCRRVLGCVEDAEDVFQATFLVLARKADSVRWKRSVAPWLYQVAYRLACKGRVAAARRRERERNGSAEGVAPAADPSWREVCAVLDEELHGLAEKYRAPLVLCYLEGLTRDEAAERLGWSLGTLKRRLQQGRERLRLRLVRRGVTLPAVLLSASLSARETTAALSPLAVHELTRSAAAFASGSGAGAPCSRALPLAEAALRMMPASHAKLAAVLLGVLSLAAGAGLWTCWAVVAQTPQPQPNAARPAALDRGEPQAPKDERSRTDRYGDPLPPGAVARLGTIRLRHPQWVNSVVFTPDGKALASAGWEGTIRLWDQATGKELSRFEGPPKGVSRVTISSDGKTLVSSGNDGMIRVWDVHTRKCRFAVKGHEGSWVACVAISPDGKLLASGGGGNRTRTLMVWDLATGKEVRRLGDNMRTVMSVAFSPDGKLLAAASAEARRIGNPADQEGSGIVRLWETATGKLHWEKHEETGGATVVAFAPDGKTVASAGYDSVIHIRDMATGKEVHKIQVPEDRYSVQPAGRKGFDYGGVLALAYSPDGKLLASADYDGTVRVWEAATSRAIHVLRGHGREATSIAFAPDGQTLASCGRDHTIRLWDVASGAERRSRQGHAGPVNALAVSRDGKRLVSAGLDQVLRLWDLKSGAEQYVLRGPGHENSVALSPDGQIVAAAGGDAIQLWNTITARPLRRLRRQTGAFSVAFSPDGKMLACGSATSKVEKEDTLFVYDSVSGREARRIAASTHDFYGRVAFSADGKMLGAAGFGVQVWDSATGRQLYHGKGEKPFAFAPDGTTLVVRNDDKTIRLYDIPSGRELQRFREPNEPAHWPFALSPDGRTLVWATKDHAIECWELASWKRRRRFTGHQGEILRLVFSADGRTLFSASRDTTVLIWDRTRADEARKVRLTAHDLPALWRDLAGDDGERADRAIWLLAGAAESTVPFLEKHVQPTAAVDPEQLTHLIADLDSDQFAVRDQAARQLEALGELAEAELRKVLADKPSLEVRRRAEGLLEKLRGPLIDAERLRSLRAVEVLEHAGTKQARRLLARLAGGAPEARLTREAKAAVQRLTAAGPPR